ncbi:nitroreductase family protein [Nocardia sp. FBN12]|uniref:nitroreductase family protein n=1 Tax=Nocardia sp. FBN12 TaxID=3419766 RepID=UPI003CFD454C
MPERPALDLFDALHSTPARRYLEPDPIDESVLWDLLDAAIRGPSGGNSQGWGWVVVTDPQVKQTIADWYRDGWERVYGNAVPTAQSADSGLTASVHGSAEYLAAHLQEAPVFVFPVLTEVSESPLAGASIYGAVQHLMLAARAYGIGSTLTSLHAFHESEVAALLGLPENARTMALIPLGYPARGRWSEPKRKPVQEVTHWGRWGQHRERPDDAGGS